MNTFQTPQPIAVVVDVSVRADIRIVAGNRIDTVVNVRPREATRALDIKAAEQTTVDYTDGTPAGKAATPAPPHLVQRRRRRGHRR